MKQVYRPGNGALTEPPDYGIGRSRGGLSTKAHHTAYGRGRPLPVLIGAGRAGDALACLPLLA
jgi:hypothetical protein